MVQQPLKVISGGVQEGHGCLVLLPEAPCPYCDQQCLIPVTLVFPRALLEATIDECIDHGVSPEQLHTGNPDQLPATLQVIWEEV